jgi:hypothetical protein
MKVFAMAFGLAALCACSDDDSGSANSAGGSGGGAASAGSGAGGGSSGGGGASGGGGTSGSSASGGSAGDAGSASGCVPRATGWITDLADYPEPSAAAPASAGSVTTDPTFGTTLLRVTDAGDGGGCVNAYSYWPSFNADSTRMFVACDGDPWLYDFDPSTPGISNRRPLYAGKTSSGSTPNWEDAIWSATDANAIYAHDTTRLWRYDVEQQTYTLLKDFGTLLGGGHVRQMSKSQDDQVFGFTTQNASWGVTGALAWRASDDQLLIQQSQPGLDEVQVDKSGEFLVIKTGNSGKGVIEVRVVDLGTGAIEDLTDDAPDFSPGHSDNGVRTVIGADNWTNRVTFRKLATPHQPSTVLDFGNDWTQDFHVSMLAKDESRVTLSLYQVGSHTTGLFHNEIIQVATDGSQAVRRLAHHRSQHGDYWDSPRANISQDGCFVAFTSRFQGTNRRDVYVLDLSK